MVEPQTVTTAKEPATQSKCNMRRLLSNKCNTPLKQQAMAMSPNTSHLLPITAKTSRTQAPLQWGQEGSRRSIRHSNLISQSSMTCGLAYSCVQLHLLWVAVTDHCTAHTHIPRLRCCFWHFSRRLLFEQVIQWRRHLWCRQRILSKHQHNCPLCLRPLRRLSSLLDLFYPRPCFYEAIHLDNGNTTHCLRHWDCNLLLCGALLLGGGGFCCV